jgi:hypothetical protein
MLLTKRKVQEIMKINRRKLESLNVMLETDNAELRKTNKELLKALSRVIDYAAEEASSLDSLGKGDERTAEEAKKAWLAVNYATRILTRYKE